MISIKKKLLIAFTLMAAFAFNLDAQIEFTEIKSETDWKKALERADTQDKLVFLDIYATWCGPCKYLDSNVFVDSLLGDYYNQNFVNLKMDGESEFGRTIASEYALRGFPTLYYVDQSGDVIIDIVGVREAGPLLTLGKNVNMGGEKLAGFEAAHAKGELSSSELVEYQNLLTSLEQEEKASELGSDIVGKMGMVELLDPENKNLVLSSTYDLDSKVFDLIRNDRTQATEAWGDEGVDKIMTGIYNDALFEAVNNQNEELLQRVINEFIPVYTKGDSAETDRGTYITRKVYLANTGMWDRYRKLVESTMESNFPENDEFLRGEAYELVNEYNRDQGALDLAHTWSKQVVEMNPQFDNLLLLAYMQGMKSELAQARETASRIRQMELSDEQEKVLNELDKIIDQAESQEE